MEPKLASARPPGRLRRWWARSCGPPCGAKRQRGESAATAAAVSFPRPGPRNKPENMSSWSSPVTIAAAGCAPSGRDRGGGTEGSMAVAGAAPLAAVNVGGPTVDGGVEFLQRWRRHSIHSSVRKVAKTTKAARQTYLFAGAAESLGAVNALVCVHALADTAGGGGLSSPVVSELLPDDAFLLRSAGRVLVGVC